MLQDPIITENPGDRCYFCKKKIFGAILRAAESDGYPVLMDGTNASDDCNDRPGMRAIRELKVLSPLRICGLTKAEIRETSRKVGLFTWDKPAYACLATRIPTGEPITAGKLSRTQWAEAYLHSLGFLDFRVRTFEDRAKIQVKQGDLPLVLSRREEIVSTLKEQYREVLLDLEVRV